MLGGYPSRPMQGASVQRVGVETRTSGPAWSVKSKMGKDVRAGGRQREGKSFLHDLLARSLGRSPLSNRKQANDDSHEQNNQTTQTIPPGHCRVSCDPKSELSALPSQKPSSTSSGRCHRLAFTLFVCFVLSCFFCCFARRGRCWCCFHCRPRSLLSSPAFRLWLGLVHRRRFAICEICWVLGKGDALTACG